MSSPKTPPLFDAPRLRRSLARWFRADGRDLPWRRTRDPYAIMVSEFMLQQTQVATVVAYFERWMRQFPDFAALAAASEAAVLRAWEGLGYYSRARNLHRSAQEIVARHGGEMPGDPATIRELPGVGRYTAGAIASFAFDRSVPVVDANIARVLARLFDLREAVDSSRGSAAIWQAAADLLPARGGRLHTSALMELGALVCLPRKPRCLICPARSHCRTTDPESLPVKRPGRSTVAVDEHCGWIVNAGRVLLQQQIGPRWTGLWKLPPHAEADLPANALVELDYPFTHHRVTLRVFAGCSPRRLSAQQRWFPINELLAAACPSPHRRAIETLTAQWHERCHLTK